MFPNARRRAVERAVAMVLLLLPAASVAAGRAPARVTSSDDAGVVFRVNVAGAEVTPGALEGTDHVEIPGFVADGTPGVPPTFSGRFLVALPPEGGYTVDFRVVEWTPLDTRRLEPNATPVGSIDDDLGPIISQRFVVDEAAYDAWVAPPVVEAAEPVWVRHNRALPVLVHPLSYDPASGRASLAKTVEVTVRFARGGGGGDTGGRAAAAESRVWDDILPRLFVNTSQARTFRTAPRFDRAATTAARSLVEGPQVKLHVYETGVYRVSASTLIAAGFPAGRPISSLHLFRRTYDDDTLAPGITDAAVAVDEDPAGTPGTFDGDDMLVFYALGLRDDPQRGDRIRKFSDYNVYWLGADSGPAMATKTLTPGFVTADTASASFTATGHFELDAFFRETSPPGTQDFYVRNAGTVPGPVDQPFDIGLVKPGTSLDLSADLYGFRYVAPRAIRLTLLNSAGSLVLDAAYSIPNRNHQVFTAQIPAANLVPGTNTFRMARPPGVSRPGVEVHLNWVEVSYTSLYRARNNTLHFDTATLSGDTSVTVTGLTDSNVWVLDVTDADAPVRCTAPGAAFTPTGGGTMALSFRDNITARHDYVVIPESRMVQLTAADVMADTPSAIIGSAAEGGVDVLVVANALFLDRMQQWVRYRRAQGYRVLMVDVDDVFDEFNGGVPGARAIDRFTRHFFELGGAGALVLIGDASEDARGLVEDSGPNFVPTHSWADHVSVLDDDEVVTTDKEYVKLPGPGGVVDDEPDMIVGRLPVGADSELQRVLFKIFEFEAPRADDFWRKRMILVADDAFSTTSTCLLGQLGYNPAEEDFERGQERVARVIENSLPAGYDVVRFYLREKTTAIHPDNGCISQTTATNYVRGNVTPELMDDLAQGATMVSIQAHMNRYLICHEKLLSTESGSLIGGGAGSDHLRMANRGRPWILFGLGCHLSDYAVNGELGRVRNQPNGDAFCEQVLFANDTGAVSTYASAGYEYLNQTNAFMTMTARVWFYEAPYDTMINQTQGRWMLGNLMYLTESRLGSYSNAVERYHILGDPMLRIDAGPPAFDVTVNGVPYSSGDIVGTGGVTDTASVVAVVTDENVIEDFKLTIDGVDRSGDLTVEPLVDAQLDNARQYRVSFTHKLLPRSYDIVLGAYQAPDTNGTYQMAAEFVLRVASTVSLSVNGRVVESGAIIPPTSDFLVEVKLPVAVAGDSIRTILDDEPVADAVISQPTPDDSTTWNVTFTRTLDPGAHRLVVQAGSANEFVYDLVVSSKKGIFRVINYPNPFADVTSFIYSNDVPIDDGRIDIYTVSGRRVRRLVIPPTATQPGENVVTWDGRDEAGGAIANGVYLYVITVSQGGESSTVRGKLSRIE